MLKLIVDDRESKVIPHFEEEYDNIEIIVKRLQVADYVITRDSDQILFAIERKSWSDLSSSIKDGRKENVNKLKRLRTETNCKLIYLIEGGARFAPTKSISHIPYKNLQAHLDHLIIRDNITILYSSSTEDTPKRLIEFMTNYLSLDSIDIQEFEGKLLGGSSSDSNDSGDSSNSKKILYTFVNKTDIEIIYNMWSAIPNITTKTAGLFIEKGYQVTDLLLGKIPKQDISLFQYTNGTIIGGKRASKIIKIASSSEENYKHYCNIIGCIPLVTKKTAGLILLKLTIVELLNGVMSIDDLANIQKTEKKKLGKAAANNIYKFLVHNNTAA
jgi:ERCC4-type nuclease